MAGVAWQAWHFACIQHFHFGGFALAKEKISSVPALELVEVGSWYVRRHLDRVYIADLARALDAGVVLPPLIADAATKTLVDGWQRKRAHQKHAGDLNVPVPVIFRHYPDEVSMFKASIELNATHGRRLDAADLVHITLIATRLGIPPEEVAIPMRRTVEAVREITLRIVPVAGTNDSAPIKPVGRFLAGGTATPEQAEAMASFSGYSFGQHLAQLHAAIQACLYDRHDQELLQRLHSLAKLIVANVPPPALTVATA
jgi:hypothetical protein